MRPLVTQEQQLLPPCYGDEYCSGLFSDELDQMGLRQQVAPGFAMNDSKLRAFGKVRTVLLEEAETSDERIGLGLGFLGRLGPGDVLVVQGSMRFAYFGELMSRLSQRQQLSGVVVEGLTRDSFYTQTIGLPIWYRGLSPVDIKGRGRVAAVDVPVRIGGVGCAPGDYLFGDSDAAVVVPAASAETALGHVRRAAAHEQLLKRQIAEGLSVEQILEQTSGF